MLMSFITVDRNGKIKLWLDEPVKNKKSGKWEGKFVYINSIALKNAKAFVEQTNMTWDSEAVPIKL